MENLMAYRKTGVAVVALVLSLVVAANIAGQQTAEPPLATPGDSRVQPQPIPTAPTDPRAQLTETVGMLSGLYLYQTYLNIGLLADGKAERLYEEKAARAVLASVVTPLDAVDRQLAQVGAQADTQADRDAANRLRHVVGLLRRQGQQLVVFWDTRNPADGARYEATRQEVWNHLYTLLKLDRK